LVSFCNNHHEKYLIHYSHVNCFWNCNTTMLYPYSCECPNNCFQETGNGHCFENKCNCNPGWKGKDCSLVTKNNLCNLNGVLSVDESNREFCKCNKGYTGTFCTTKTELIDPLPYKEEYPNDRNYYSIHERYKDNHPLFNLSTVSTIKIYVSEEDLLKIINPSLSLLNNWYYGNLTIQNENYFITKKNIGLRIKGWSGRVN
jgi:hypothetical protein